MPTRETDLNACEALWTGLEALIARLARNRARNVNSASLRTAARDFVMGYFGEARPALQRIGVGQTAVAELDADMQRLIGLSTGKNSKSSYLKFARGIRAKRKSIETGLDFLIASEPNEPGLAVSDVEKAIIATLQNMLPSAAGSYRQVLTDISGSSRKSYRGTAAELREAVREVLDHLAPDADVEAMPGYKQEAGLSGPSMKQKVRFILRARKATDAARETAERSAEHVENSVSAIGRAVYTRGSTDVHTARPLEEIRNFKLYADAILGELLEINRRPTSGSERQSYNGEPVQTSQGASVGTQKREILKLVLVSLSRQFEQGTGQPRVTFRAGDPSEAQPLSEVLAALRAERAINEFAGTYAFTSEGYAKYKPTL